MWPVRFQQITDCQIISSVGAEENLCLDLKKFFSAGLATLLTAIRASGVNHVSSFSRMDLGIFGGRKRRTVRS